MREGLHFSTCSEENQSPSFANSEILNNGTEKDHIDATARTVIAFADPAAIDMNKQLQKRSHP
jgi:hypothetical protein